MSTLYGQSYKDNSITLSPICSKYTNLELIIHEIVDSHTCLCHSVRLELCFGWLAKVKRLASFVFSARSVFQSCKQPTRNLKREYYFNSCKNIQYIYDYIVMAMVLSMYELPCGSGCLLFCIESECQNKVLVALLTCSLWEMLLPCLLTWKGWCYRCLSLKNTQLVTRH